MTTDYNWLLNTATGEKWQRIGAQKCSGVVVPLFSIHSTKSIGLGEFPDLKLMVDWCKKTGMKIIQLLPLNDVGYTFTPYDCQSMFALDPMYLSLENLQQVNLNPFSTNLAALKDSFPCGQDRVDYKIKGEKLALLWKIFQSSKPINIHELETFIGRNKFWLNDYALYKVLKNQFQEKDWLNWDKDYRHKLTSQVQDLINDKSDELLFQKWLQWQAFEQLTAVKEYANKNSIYLMGDLPFLVSKDSADVWANQDYFKLGYAAGAPPDLYFAEGQQWGMPPYNWDIIAEHDYDYLTEKLIYAQSFYDLYRIDHFVGIFRLWVIPTDPTNGNNGFFDPPQEEKWEAHGKRILDVMLKASTMLPCAEDLGTVPDCSYKVIKAYGVVGTDIQRWMKWWNRNCEFKSLTDYRSNGIAALSTHDLPIIQAWWENEVATIDEEVFRKKCEDRGLDANWLIGQLFYPPTKSGHRLKWREEINNVDKLLGIIYRQPDEVRDFIELFNCSRFEKEQYLKLLDLEGETIAGFSISLAQKILEKTNESASIFSIQLLADWLSVSMLMKSVDPINQRINEPGIVANSNWSMVMPFTLEQLNHDPSTQVLYKLNKTTGRID